MKPRKHKRKESFSILFVSNTGQNSRQFHVTRGFIRLVTVFLLLVFAVFGWFMYQYVSDFQKAGGFKGGGMSKSTDASQEELLAQIADKEEQLRKLEEEKEVLSDQNSTLTTENKALLEAAKAGMGTAKTDNAAEEQETDEEDSAPGRYPYSEQGDLSVKFSQDHPYVCIDTQNQGDVVAAGDGTVSMVGSDDTYPLIIEIEHGDNYRTRYMFLQDAESAMQEGAEVHAGDTLVTLGEENVQLDYQVIFEGQPIDPLIVFEAKG